MYRDPGVPAYLRAPSRALIALLFLAFAVAALYVGAFLSWTLALVLLLGVAGTLLGLWRLEWALIGLILMSSLDGFIKPLLAERFSLFLKDYFILLAFTRWMYGLIAGEDRPSVRSVAAVPLMLFAAYVIAELANPNSKSLMLGLAGARTWLLWLPVFFVAYDAIRSRAVLERLWQFAIGVSALIGAYGIVQYFIGFEHLYRLSERFRYYEKMGYWIGKEEKVLRVIGTMVHPGAFGVAMGCMALIAAGFAFGASTRPGRILALVCIPVLTVGLFLSGARAAMLGAGMGLVALILISRRPVLLLGALALLMLGFWQSLRVTEGALQDRVDTVTWDYTADRTLKPLFTGLDIASRHPFGMGVASGIGASKYDLVKLHDRSTPFIENEIGRAFGELGVGALLFVAVLVASAWGGVRAALRLRTARDRTLAAAFLGGALSITAGLATGSALYLAPGALYFWLAAASAMRLPELEAAEAQPPAA